MNWIKLRKCDGDNRWRKAMLAGFAGCWPETNTLILLTLDKLRQKIYKKHGKDVKKTLLILSNSYHYSHITHIELRNSSHQTGLVLLHNR